MNRHDQVLRKRLSGEGVGIVVKRYVEGLGFDPGQFAGHSLRVGLATAAAGKSERAIMNQTGHRSVNTVRRYIRDGNLFRENAAEGLGFPWSPCGSGARRPPSGQRRMAHGSVPGTGTGRISPSCRPRASGLCSSTCERTWHSARRLRTWRKPNRKSAILPVPSRPGPKQKSDLSPHAVVETSRRRRAARGN
jgi:hypothetical protein